MVWGAISSMISNSLGGLLTSHSSKELNKKQYEYNKKLQERNIAWQKEAMQNSHQWAVEDLEKAGLNPAIASTSGASAGGASASQSVGSLQAPDYAGMFNNMVNSAFNIYNESRKTDASVANINTNTAKTAAETTGQILNNEIVEKYGDKEKTEQIANTMQKTAESAAETAKKVEEANRIKGGKAAEIAGTATTAKIGKAINEAEAKIKKQRKKEEEEQEPEEQNYLKRLFNFKVTKNNNWN